MNYKVKAVQVLLCEDCVLKRYYPLFPYKNILLQHSDMTKELIKYRYELKFQDNDLMIKKPTY